MNPLNLIEKLITEHGSAAVLKERLTAIKEELSRIIQERDEFQKKTQELQKEITELRGEIEKYKKKDGFVHHRGALFRRKDGGGYDVGVYCPKCFGPMSSLQGVTNFVCGTDKTKVNFTGNDLESIMKELTE